VCCSIYWRLWWVGCLLEVLEVPEVMCCMMLCMLEAVEGFRHFHCGSFPVTVRNPKRSLHERLGSGDNTWA